MRPGARYPRKREVMTKKANAQAAFIAVTTGILDKLDAGLISRTTGVPEDQVRAMMDARREREVRHVG